MLTSNRAYVYCCFKIVKQCKTKRKEIATLYDIADDLRYGGNKNYTLGHFEERVSIYKEENFPMASYHIQLKQ